VASPIVTPFERSKTSSSGEHQVILVCATTMNTAPRRGCMHVPWWHETPEALDFLFSNCFALCRITSMNCFSYSQNCVLYQFDRYWLGLLPWFSLFRVQHGDLVIDLNIGRILTLVAIYLFSFWWHTVGLLGWAGYSGAVRMGAGQFKVDLKSDQDTCSCVYIYSVLSKRSWFCTPFFFLFRT
jgi:hypothetical protein